MQAGLLYHANGILENGEPPLGGVKVTLGAGAGPSVGLKESTTKQANLIRTFLKNLNFCTEPSTTVKKPNSMELAERRRCDFMK